MKSIGQMSGEEIKAYCRKMQEDVGHCHQDCPLYDEHETVHCELMRRRPSNWDTTTPLTPLTTSEMELCRMVGAKWVTLDKASGIGRRVELWLKEPYTEGHVYIATEDVSEKIGELDRSLFPSIQPGDKICVDMGVME